MSDLSGKTALVTGASRGIGRAIAPAPARAGTQVLVHYSSSEHEADARRTGSIIGEMRIDFPNRQIPVRFHQFSAPVFVAPAEVGDMSPARTIRA